MHGRERKCVLMCVCAFSGMHSTHCVFMACAVCVHVLKRVFMLCGVRCGVEQKAWERSLIYATVEIFYSKSVGIFEK